MLLLMQVFILPNVRLRTLLWTLLSQLDYPDVIQIIHARPKSGGLYKYIFFQIAVKGILEWNVLYFK